MKPLENIVGKGENAGYQHFLLFPQCFLPIPKLPSVFNYILFCHLQMLSVWTSLKCVIWKRVNPFPDMQILGSSNSAANKDMMPKIWTNGDSII